MTMGGTALRRPFSSSATRARAGRRGRWLDVGPSREPSRRTGQVLAEEPRRSSVTFLQPQVLDEDPRDERDTAGHAQLAVQAFQMGVNGVRRNTEVDRDDGFLLVVEHRLRDLALALGQLERPREEPPDVFREDRASSGPDGSGAETSARGARRLPHG